MKVPVGETFQRQSNSARETEASPFSQLLPQTFHTNESDWQTVTSDQINSEFRHPFELGSSLADCSDTAPSFLNGQNAPANERASQSRFDRGNVSRTPGRTANSVDWLKSGKIQKHLQDFTRTNIRRISSSLDEVSAHWSRASRGFGAHPFTRSFESLHSEAPLPLLPFQTQANCDAPSMLMDFQNATAYSPPRQDEPQGARFSFPLISLPKAARLQHLRRGEGDEDHTYSGSSFATRACSGTVSSVSTFSEIRTPLSARFTSQYGRASYKSSEPGAIRFVPNSNHNGTGTGTGTQDEIQHKCGN